MQIKHKIKVSNKSAYSDNADFWSKSRLATDLKNMDPKLIKMNRPHLFVEKPAMLNMLPDLTGKKVLCLGCGSGEEIELLEQRSATEITGIDIAGDLIKNAKSRFPKYEFYAMDAEKLTFPDNSFDFVFSSLVFDYFKDWTEVLSQINRVLKKDGQFQFSIIHPVKWAGQKINDEDGKAVGTLMGYKKNDQGKQEIFGNYHDTVKHKETWMGSMEVTYYTMPISQMVKYLIAGGFDIVDIDEPKAIDLAKEFDIDYWEANQKIPNFILFLCRKN